VLEAEAGGGGRGRHFLAVRVEHSPHSCHAKVHVHDRERPRERPKKAEEILAHCLNPLEGLAVNRGGAVGEAPVGARGRECFAHQHGAVARGGTVHTVSLDHGRARHPEVAAAGGGKEMGDGEKARYPRQRQHR